MSRRRSELPVSALRWTCPASFVSRLRPAPVDLTFGQARASEALATALEATVPQHVFVAGGDGPDRLPLVLALLRAPTAARAVVVAEDLSRDGLFGASASPAEPGALLRADGGVLVLEVDDLVRDPELWTDVRRVLRDRRVLARGRSASVAVSFVAVLVGHEGTYARLFDEDPSFTRIVPIKATVVTWTRADARTVRAYGSFALDVGAHERLRAVAPGALAALAEESMRATGRRGRLSLKFHRLRQWVREADHVAKSRGARRIEDRDVLEGRRRAAARLGAQERRTFEDVLAGRVLIGTAGEAVGQVNGLAVHDYGNLGLVARITATVGPGREGLVNVEREVALSGASYDKGVHILAGYLTEALACTHAAALSIRIVFEQSYGHLTGDSATCGEACAVLSALAELPVRQDLAITGSMNQHGAVQAIGGVNQKIEAFYDLCAARGLTGTQGVVIPESNADDLMLRRDVVAACRARRFHVHVIRRIEEGLALLTGRPAGRPTQGRDFPAGSVFALASERAEDLTRLSRAPYRPEPPRASARS